MKRGKGLALFIAVAMVVCAFAMIVPAMESNADTPSTTLGENVSAFSDGGDLSEGGLFYVGSEGAEITAVPGYGKTATVILANGAKLTFADSTTVSSVSIVLAATGFSNGTVSYYDGLEIKAIKGTYIAAADSISEKGTTSGGNTFGVSIGADGETTYYIPAKDVGTKTLADGTTVTLMNGSATVNAGEATVKVSAEAGENDKGVTLKMTDGTFSVSGLASKGLLEVTAGDVNISDVTIPFKGVSKTADNTTTLYKSFADAFKVDGVTTTTVNAEATVHGANSEAVTLKTNGSIVLAENGSYNGNVTLKTDNCTYTVNISATGVKLGADETATAIAGYTDDGNPTIAGTSVPSAVADDSEGGDSETDDEAYAISSNVIVNSVSLTVAKDKEMGTTDALILNGIMFGNSYSLQYDITLDGDNVLPYGATMNLIGGKVTIKSSATWTILGGLRTSNNTNTAGMFANDGLIYTNDKKTVDLCTTGSGNVKSIDDPITITGADEQNAEILMKALQGGLDVTLDNVNVLILDDVVVNGGTISLVNGATIQVGLNDDAESKQVSSGTDAKEITVKMNNTDTKPYSNYLVVGSSAFGSLTLNNATIDIDKDASDEIKAKIGLKVGYLSELKINNSMIYTVVDAPSGSVKVNNKTVVYNESTSSFKVGYATELDFSGSTVGKVDVYGKLVVKSNATITSEITVYQSGQFVIDQGAAVTVTGEAVFLDRSESTVNGDLTLGSKSAVGSMTVGKETGADFVISETGTFTMLSSFNKISQNMLTINGSDSFDETDKEWSPRFLVEGTATFRGIIDGDGAIHNNGTVTYDAASGEANMVLYDGITVGNIKTAGKLTVTDGDVAKAMDSVSGTKGYTDGNTIVLDNVTGVTVTENLKQVSWTNKSTQKTETGYQAIMTVSGSVQYNAEEKATIGIGSATENGNPTIGPSYTAYVSVADTLTVGSGVKLTVTGTTLNVSGELTVTASSEINKEPWKAEIDNTGTITVSGTMTVREDHFITEGTVNAVKRVVTISSDGKEIADSIYTGFSAAVDAGLDADDKEITVLGKITASASKDIPEGLTVIVDGTLTVGKDADLVFKAGSALEGTGNITVNGLMTVEDTDDMTLNESSVSAAVITVDEPSKTWTSLNRALSTADEGSTITLNQPVKITENTTIPAGVTVSTGEIKYNNTDSVITIEGCTLTVDGTLQMEKSAQGAIALTANDEGTTGKMVIGSQGVFSASGISAAPEDVRNVTGAHFAMVANATKTYYVTNLAYAAETTAGKIVDEPGITVKGTVTATDVTFKGGVQTLDVYVEQISGNPEDITILNAGNITLDNASLTIKKGNARVSATVNASVGGTDSVVKLTSAKGDLTITDETDGSDEYMYMTGTVDGKVSVTSGTVTVDNSLTVGKDSAFTVSNGATLNVPAGSTFTNNAEDEATVIDGTLEVAGTVNGSGTLVVNGDMKVETYELAGTVRITGNLTVTENKTMTVTGTLILGAKPSTLGATGAVLAGDITMNSADAAILAYAGADVSGARINWNTTLGENTVYQLAYNINGVKYADVITSQTSTFKVGDINDLDDEIALSGLWTVGYWFENAEDAEAAKGAVSQETPKIDNLKDVLINNREISEVSVAYAAVGPSIVTGTYSLGAGMVLYIDDVVYNAYPTGNGESAVMNLTVGTHTVKIVAKANYSIANATITFNGQNVANGGSITITADMDTYLLKVDGAIQQLPNNNTGDNTAVDSDDGMSITDILLIVLVVLIAVMAVMVALRLMRS